MSTASRPFPGTGITVSRLFVLIALVAALPVLLVRYLPLIDLPGHQARFHVLESYSTQPYWQNFFEVTHKLLPNLAFDWLNLLFLRFLPMEDASRLFVLLSMALFAVGCAMLSHIFHGRITMPAVLALFAQYNSMFFYGFVAYQLGVAVFLITLAVWYRWHERWTPVRAGVVVLLTVLVYFGHLAAYSFLGLATLTVVLADCVRDRRIRLSAVVSLLVLALPAVFYLTLGRAVGDVQTIAWGTVIGKLRHSLVLVIGYRASVDAVVGLLLLAAALIAFLSGRVRIHRDAALMAGAFWLAFIIFPSIMLTGSDADTRFVLPAGVLTAMAVTAAVPLHRARLAMAIAITALLIRLGFVTWVWRAQSAEIAGQLALYRSLPAHSRVFTIFEWAKDPTEEKYFRPLCQIISWAAILRDAYVPTTFAVRGQHPLIHRAEVWAAPLWFTESTPGVDSRIDWDQVSRNFDVVWFHGNDATIRQLFDNRCQTLKSSGKTHLWLVPHQPLSDRNSLSSSRR